MSSNDLFPDTEGALRTWLKADPTITALVGPRVFDDVPKGAKETTFPLIAIQRIGGNHGNGDSSIDNALVQFALWGTIGNNGLGHPIKSTATALRMALLPLLHNMEGTMLDNVTVGHGADITSDIFVPDPTSRRPRYIVTALVYTQHL